MRLITPTVARAMVPCEPTRPDEWSMLRLPVREARQSAPALVRLARHVEDVLLRTLLLLT